MAQPARQLHIQPINDGVRPLREKTGRILRQAAVATASTGSVGRGAQKVVEAASQEALAAGAERAARAARMRAARKRRAQPVNQRKSKPSKKMTGIGFWFMISLTLTKDFLDILLNITVILSLVVILLGLFITFCLFFYYMYNGVSVTSRKLATMAITIILEILPFFSIVPMTTIGLFMIRRLENDERARRFITKGKHLLRYI